MAEVKWIKIVTDIFDDEKILLIESMPDKYAIIVCWFKLLCLAGKQNNSGVFLLNDRIAYTDEMLATIFRMPIPVVRLSLQTFQQFGMIELIDGVITIPNWSRHQSLDAYEKKKAYDRQYRINQRAKQAALTTQYDGRTTARTTVVVPEEDIEEDIDISLTRDKNIGAKKRPALPTLEEVEAYVSERGNKISASEWFDYYSSNGWMVGRTKMKDWKAAVRTWEAREKEFRRGNTETPPKKTSGRNAPMRAYEPGAAEEKSLAWLMDLPSGSGQ